MIRVVIPARYASTRLPQKMLADLGGVPLIVRTAQNAQQSAYPVCVAYDDERIGEALRAANISAIPTSAQHQNGSERLAEVVRLQAWDDADIVVNVQGDEPFLPPAAITQVAQTLLQNPRASMATLITPLPAAEALAPQTVKVVTNAQGEALYFSRAAIPFDRDGRGVSYFRHIGIYAYRVGILKQYPQWQASALETSEQLEQLRFLAYGAVIATSVITPAPPAGIDTADDLSRAQMIFKKETP